MIRKTNRITCRDTFEHDELNEHMSGRFVGSVATQRRIVVDAMERLTTLMAVAEMSA